MILGCDAAGLDEDGNEVVVHAVISDPTWTRRRDVRPEAVAALRASPGHHRRAGDRAEAQRRRQARVAVVRGGGLPADRVADGLPHALHPRRAQGRRHRAGAGRRRRRGHRADHAGAGRRAAGAGHQPRRGQAGPGPRDRRARGLRVRRPAAGQGRRRDGDRRQGDLVALDPGAATRRRDRHLRHDVGPEARRRRADPHLLPPAQRDRLHDGHPRRARLAGRDARRHRRAPAHRPRPSRSTEARDGFAAMADGDVFGKIVFTL